MTTSRQDLKLLEEELKQDVPEPVHSMLEKETKEEAIEKHKARKLKETVICPLTCTGNELGVMSYKYILIAILYDKFQKTCASCCFKVNEITLFILFTIPICRSRTANINSEDSALDNH